MNQRYRGIILVLIATPLFSVLDTSSKFLTAHYAAAQIVWMRYLCQFILVLLIVAPGRWREITMTRRPLLTILRGAMQGCSSLFVVMAFSTLPLAETTSMVFISPLLVALFAGPILGEKVSRGQWLLIVAGFSGVLLIARPGGSRSRSCSPSRSSDSAQAVRGRAHGSYASILAAHDVSSRSWRAGHAPGPR